MGYELTRFICEIDEEFHCPICKMILKEPVQSSCQHIFCHECMIVCLQDNKCCPIDSQSLKFEDVKSAEEDLCKRLDALKIKCDCGCQAVLKLKHLPDHLKKTIICNKGCSMKLSRDDFETHNCISHLADQLSRQDGTITKLNNEVSRLQKIITELNVKEDNPSNSENSDTTFTPCLQWRTYLNIKEAISSNETNILRAAKIDAESNVAFAQLFHPLEPDNPSFKAQILKQGVVVIGVTSIDHPVSTCIGFYRESIGYGSKGLLHFEGETKTVGPRWDEGDIIECEIKFPENNDSPGVTRVTVCFFRNRKLRLELFIDLPRHGFYPTVQIEDKSAKVKLIRD